VQVMREVAAEFERPVLLFSGGKDSIVLLRLAEKAFRPGPFPFPVMHIDTGHNFPEAIEFRDRRVAELGERLIVASVEDSIRDGRVVEQSGPRASRNGLQTVTLLDAIAEHGFDAAFGGARRDEEKSRAKERVFSFRSTNHHWDPKNQRPEIWNLYNAKKGRGETIRVFPISNWTELDIWQYIQLQDIPIVPLYFAAPRPTVLRDGMILMVDDDRFRLEPGERVVDRSIRFRTLGCYPLSGAIESYAATLPEVIQEMLLTTTSERQGRAIDHDQAASMEKKKQEGYF
jgi:sulfate adenylyltransferase subunit 2